MNPNRLIEILLSSDLGFVVIGAFAGVLHGSSTVTKDIDLCMELTPTNIQQLRKILAPHNPTHRGHPQRLSFLEHPSGLENVRNLYLQTELGPIDFLSEIMGVGDFSKVKKNAITISLFDHSCQVLSLDALIVSKKAMGREKDIPAVKELEEIQRKLLEK